MLQTILANEKGKTVKLNSHISMELIKSVPNDCHFIEIRASAPTEIRKRARKTD